jgi:ribosome-associated toxin RatA of RatAB toxin-antitoxin module
MLNLINYKLFVVVFLLLFSQLSYAKTTWQLNKEDDGIKVYVRDTQGSVVKSFKGEVIISASLTSLVLALEDTKSYPQFLHNCKKSSNLKIVSPSESYKYIVTNMPWPVEDRDMIVHSLMSQDKTSKIVTIKLAAAPKELENKVGLVRIKKMLGSWRLIPEAKGQVKVIYEMNVDPGGSLPKWLVNSLAVDIPFHTLRKLRKQLKKPAYQNIKHSLIID